jgi:hypothetical protein
MTIVHYIVVILLILLSIALTWACTKYYYSKIINAMTIKNQHLIERVKKLISIISPDDIDSQKSGE